MERHHQVWKHGVVRRWDPLSERKRRAQILLPDRCKLQDLPAGLEKWEELVRRYEWNKSCGTTALDDDIKTAALEALVPGEVEEHLAMNRARLITYEQIRIEARRSKFALKTVALKVNSDPMEVDRCGKGGKKGKKERSTSEPEPESKTRTLFVGIAVRKAI